MPNWQTYFFLVYFNHTNNKKNKVWLMKRGKELTLDVNSNYKVKLGTVDNKLNEDIDLDLKDKILKVKDKLLRMTYNPDEYVKDINSVYELKNSVATEE